MNRRTFLKTTVKAIVVGSIAPNAIIKALPKLVKPLIVGNTALCNSILTPNLIVSEALRQLKNNLAFTNLVAKEYNVLPELVIDRVKIEYPRNFHKALKFNLAKRSYDKGA